MTGRTDPDYGRIRLIEAMMVASVDHGVTPPSAQATILAASVRAAFEVSLASGVSGITDVHGGAGARAAEFFRECADLAEREQLSLFDSTVRAIRNRLDKGIRIEGLGHRVHTRDPRRDVLWKLADSWAVSGQCSQISREVEKAFETVRGMTLPVNVDGVIGAITADMDLDPRVAKALFLFGRVAGLAAHYFEEVSTQLPMRRIDYSRAVYRGP
jgi:citrate synthase